jgi:tetratricopeptide (TPR) repeat protein
MHEQEVTIESTKLIAVGNFEDAIVKLKAASIELPKSFEVWSLLSKCLFEKGNLKDAVQASQHARSIDPLEQDFQRIQALIHRQAYSEASQIAHAMLTKHKSHPRAICTLAQIATTRNDPQTSVLLLEAALDASPADLPLRNMLTNSYASAGYFAKALQAAKTLVALDETFDSLWTLIGLLLKYGQYDDLLSACELAKSYVEQNDSPSNDQNDGENADHNSQRISQLELIRGQALRIMGNRAESVQALKASLASDSLNADAWWALADMKDYAFSDAERKEIESISTSPNIDNRRKCIAKFALAKASELSASPSEMMAYYNTANALGVSDHYHPKMLENEFKARMNAYNKESLLTQACSMDDKSTPIFIVGLPRSGSTLVEQILASHGDIVGTLEQATLPIIESRAQTLCMQRYNLPLTQALDKLTGDELSQLGKAYLDESALFRSKSTPFFIDKQPFNFRLIGFIHKILPHAIIIDVRRNPQDCGFSLYKQYFHSGVDFSYKLSHIGAVYNAYVKLMDHWHSALPSKVLTLQYETLVNYPEREIRALLIHVGVEFDERCLHFYQTKRNIHTASSEQVRKPMNKNGIGVWRKVESELFDLIDSLEKSDVFNI